MEERRNTLRRHAQALIAAGLLAGAMGGAQACELPPGTRLESKRFVLSYRSIPSRIVVGEHFALELAICPKQGAALPERVKLDAQMPEHKHGMNYRPDVKTLGAGRYLSNGWLFHMPGRWEFSFELGGERVSHSVRIE